MANYFGDLVGQLREMVDDCIRAGESKALFGTVRTVDPLSIELETGIILPESKFYLPDFVTIKKVKFPATYTGELVGDISGNVQISNVPDLHASGPISGRITIRGVFGGIMESECIWTGLEVDDVVLLTSHNHGQRYVLHSVMNREPQTEIE